MIPVIITAIDLIDTAGTTVATLQAGQTVSVDEFTGRTLAIVFSGPISQVTFHVDNGPAVIQQAPPYVVNNKHPIQPLSVTAGPHTISWQANAQPADAISFTLTPSATTTQQLAPPGVLGVNAAGIADAMLDPQSHPQYLTYLKAQGATVLRTWSTTAATQRQKATDWVLLEKYQAAGISNILVYNFQNESPRCSAPAAADLVAWIEALPAGLIHYLTIGNEVDTAGPATNSDNYFIGTPQQLVNLYKAAYPVCQRLGIKLVAPSVCHGLAYLQSLIHLGIGPFVDLIDYHPYYSSASSILTEIDLVIAYGNNDQ